MGDLLLCVHCIVWRFVHVCALCSLMACLMACLGLCVVMLVFASRCITEVLWLGCRTNGNR